MSPRERRMAELTVGVDRFVALRRAWRDDVRLSIVLVPGWREPRSGHLRLFARLADALREAGLPVETWQFDLAGQGESGLPDDAGRWPGQLAAVIRACRAPAYLVGRGAGAVLASAWIPSAPVPSAPAGGVARVVAVDPPRADAGPHERLAELGCEEAVLPDVPAGRRRAGALWADLGAATYDLTVSGGDALDAIPADIVRLVGEGAAC